MDRLKSMLFSFQSRKKKALLLLILIGGLAAILLVLNQTTNLFSRAQIPDNIELEQGVLSGNATIGSDSQAAGGQYVQLGSLTSTTNFQPSAPYYATFFYIWYKNPNTDGSWSYWPDHGKNPPQTWFSHYIPDVDPNTFNPATELYSANNYDVFKWQVSKLAEAKQEVAIASWWGQGTKEDVAFNNIINSFMGRADNPYPNLRWSMYYEQEGFGDPSVSQLVNDLNHIKNTFTNSPYYLKINGKPVIFVYGNASDEPGTLVQRWSDANTQVGNSFYYVLKLFNGYANASPQPSSWHQYAPAVRSGQHGNFSYFVSPGFWLDDNVSTERLPRNATEFENVVQSMVSANATWKLTETWNEWGEGTSVEPGEQVRTVNGVDQLDPNGYPFKNLYVDILNRNLPPLEQGPGVNPSGNPSPTQTAGSPVVVAVGDIACGAASTGAACKEQETSDLALAQNPNAVLLLGDTQYESGELADWNNFFDPTWGRLISVSYPTHGNHEYNDPAGGAKGTFDYFEGKFGGPGNTSTRPGARNQGYYAFNLGNWRIYSLNSNCSQAGGCGAGSPQETWLRQDLTANPRECVLAMFHHPQFSSGSRTSTAVKPLVQALYDNKADLLLVGHEHNYERFAQLNPDGQLDTGRGIRHFVVGTGGRNFTQFVTTAPNSQARNDNTFGVLKLALHPTSYDYNFLPIPGSTYTDSGSGTCVV